MALGDPFGVTAQLAQERGKGIEEGAATIGAGLGQAAEGMQTQQLLEQAGIVTKKEQPHTIDELKKIAQDHFGKDMVFNIKSTLPKEEQARQATQLMQSFGIPLSPKPPKIEIDLDKMAEVGTKTGMEYKPGVFGGAVAFKPPAPKTGVNIADMSNLSSEQQIQARALARKLYGVRGAEAGIPSIVQEMILGKTIDQIEDTLRYSGQSKEFAPIRSAAQQIMVGKSGTDKQSTFDDLDDLRDKPEEQKAYIKRMALVQAGQEEKRNMMGKERTIKLLDEIQGDLNNLEAMGVDTNIFTGTQEQIAAKAGTVVNPEARRIATKTAAAIQNYRRSMTGVQFGMPENQEYKVMFPSISRTANFNTANINALKQVMSGDLDNFYSLSMGEDNYNKLFKIPTPQSEDMGTQVARKAGVIPTKTSSIDAKYERYKQIVGGR